MTSPRTPAFSLADREELEHHRKYQTVFAKRNSPRCPPIFRLLSGEEAERTPLRRSWSPRSDKLRISPREIEASPRRHKSVSTPSRALLQTFTHYGPPPMSAGIVDAGATRPGRSLPSRHPEAYAKKCSPAS